MEFSEEIAVFQAAFELADKLAAGGLINFQRGGNKKAIAALKFSIKEITRGLSEDLAPEEQRKWNLQLCSLLCFIYLRSHCQDLGRLEEHYAAVSAYFTGISDYFLLEIVKQCGWQQFLVQCINRQSPDHAEHLLMRMMALTSADSCEPNIADLEVIIAITKYLLISSNQFICGEPENFGDDEQPARQHNQRRFLSCVVRQLLIFWRRNYNRNVCKEEVRLTLSLSLLNLLRFLLCKKIHLIDLDTALSQEQSNNEHQYYFLEKTESFLVENLVSTEAYILPVPLIETSLVICDDVTEITVEVTQLLSLLATNISDMVRLVCDNNSDKIQNLVSADRMPSAITSHMVAQMLVANLAMFECVSSEALSVISDQGRYLQDLFRPISEELRKWQKGKMVEERLPDCMLKKATLIMDNNLQGYEDWCLWLTDIDEFPVHEHPRWLSCLKKETTGFVSTLCVSALIRQLEAARKTKQEKFIKELQPIIIHLFDELTLVDKLTIIHTLSEENKSHENEGDIFLVGEEYSQDMTFTFNRLVNDAEGGVKATLKLLCPLILQRPWLVLSRIVNDAIKNTAQTELLGQVIQEVWPSTEMNSTRLLTDLSAVLTTETLTRQEANNLTIFIRTLLKPCKSLVDPCVSSPGVLSAGDVLSQCVNPHLHSRALTNTRQQPPLEVTLAILKVTLETTAEYDCRVLMECHLLPTVLCLCVLVEDCDDPWVNDPETGVRKMSIIQNVYKLLDDTCQRLSEAECGDTDEQIQGLSWLYNHLQSLRWTTRLLTWPLFSRKYNGKFPHVLPESLQLIIQANAQSEDLTFEATDDNDMSALLQLCMMSDVTEDYVATYLLNDQLLQIPSLENHLQLFLPKILMVATGAQWVRIANMLHLLIKKGILPTEDETELAELDVAIRLTLTLQLLFRCNLWPLDSPAWNHLLRGYSTSIKVSVVDSLEKTSDHSQLPEVLPAVFTQLCLILRSAPPTSTDPVFVLALDLLCTIQGLVTQSLEKSKIRGQVSQSHGKSKNKELLEKCDDEENITDKVYDYSSIAAVIAMVPDLSQRDSLEKLIVDEIS